MIDPDLAFKLDKWHRDALMLATCTSCYGSGEDRWNEGRACPTCEGKGKAPREPHVVELVDMVRELLK